METITVFENYGPVKVEQEYRVVEDGYDYVKIICQGQPIYVPVDFVKVPGKQRFARKDLESYEDIVGV